MNIGSILKGAAGIALDVFAPGSRQVVNALLPDDKQLPEGSTGKDAEKAIDSLPPEQKKAILAKEIDLKIAQEEGWTARYVAMTQADGQSTRPKIALMMANLLCAETLAFSVLLFWRPDLLTDSNTWQAFLVLTGVPAGLLGKYFGELRREQRNRQESMGAPPAIGMLGTLIQSFKK